MPQKIKYFADQVQGGFKLGGRPSLIWALIGFMAGLISFVLDLLLAICLQRFFVATDLISDLNQTRFFGPLRSSRSEAILLLLVGASRMLFYWCSSAANGISQVSYEKKAREKIAIWAIWQGKSSTGNVANLYSDIVLGASQSISNIQFVFVRIFMLISSLVVLAYYSIVLTLFIFLLILLVYPIQRKLDSHLTKNGVGLQASIEQSSNTLFFGLQNSVYLKIHGLLIAEIFAFKSLMNKFKKHSVNYYAAAGLRGLLPQFIALIYVVFVASRTGTKFLDSPGQLVAYLYLSIRFFQTVGDLGRVSANLRNTWPRLIKFIQWNSANLIAIENSDALTDQSFSNTKNNQSRGIEISTLDIRCEKISFAWPDSKTPVINDLSIQFDLGTWSTFFGDSGKGKSTLLKIIAGFHSPSTGRMILNLNGQRIEGSSYNIVLQNIISYIGADPVIIPGTIRDNLLHGSRMRVSDTELTKILHDYSCNFIFNLPNQLDYKITENDTGLSTGQKQRISIVRAMLRKPVVLILDEITSNLDEATELEILQSIKQNSENLIIIAAGHRKSFRTYSDFNYTFSAQGNIVQD